MVVSYSADESDESDGLAGYLADPSQRVLRPNDSTAFRLKFNLVSLSVPISNLTHFAQNTDKLVPRLTASGTNDG